LTLQIFDNPDFLPPRRPRGIGLGFFDGVHRGHMELLRTLVYECRLQKLQPAVFTFTEHPETVLRPDEPFTSYLSNLPERLRLLEGSGISETHLQSFNREFAAIEPQDFLNKILDERLQARLIVVGQDYRFGRMGHGNVEMLCQWAEERQIRVIVIRQVRLSGEKVSSSRIRSLIAAGELEQASSLLGRPYSIGGVVISGRGLGHQMGFPTANLPVPAELTCPAYGVYASRTHVGDRTYDSITNIGLRPTVNTGKTQPLIETYLYDADLILYNKPIVVEFLSRIRPEIHFRSLLQLSTQIREDLDTIREWHLNAEQCHEIIRIQDIPVYVLSTRRFSQAALQLVFYSPLDVRQASCNALLMRVLTASCRRYPTRTSLAMALDSLYGSSIETNLERQGDLQAIDLTAEGLMHWTDGSSPFQATCNLLFDMLFEPLLAADGLFDEQTVESERQNLMLELAARENDRGKYAYDRCLAMFCGKQAHGLSPVGDRQTLQQITRQELGVAYQNLLHQTSVSLYLGGQVDAATIDICLSGLKRMPVAKRPVFRPAEYPSPFLPEEPACQTERKIVEQARIVLAYHGLPPYFSHRAITATVLNSMLGGDVHSLLFDVVREKLGLAYNVYSMNQRLLSALFIVAGVAADQVEAAMAAIRSQLDNLAAGRFDPSLFERAIQMIEASILSVNDDLSTMLGQQIAGRLYGRLLTRDESISLLRSVEPAQVTELAGQIRLVSSYVLTDCEVNA
jgi:riboflavin kinase / FMN adenylyltransferase